MGVGRVEVGGRRVVVMGLGTFGGGVGAVRFLVGEGARVVVTDQRPAERLAGAMAELAGLDVQWRLGGHEEADFTRERADVVVVNPAVKPGSEYLAIARREGVELTSEMNLFFERCRGAIVGITGSNGKSTTTTMVRAVLEAGAGGKARRGYGKVWLGGNIGGGSLLARVGEIAAEDVVVLELSSFQLEWLGRIGRAPQVAVVTNLTPNHLDWHGTMEAYGRAKQNITLGQGAGDVLVLNALEENLWGWAGLSAAGVRWYPAAWGRGADGRPGAEEAWAAAEGIELAVAGRHNRVNAAAALAVGEVFGVDEAAARGALRGYRALEHRLELVREVDGVEYYNDSIATTPESTVVAVEAFAGEKFLILGGSDKGIEPGWLMGRLAGEESVRFVALLGAVADRWEAALAAAVAERGSRLEWARAGGLAEAVGMCRARARAGAVVLLSPATASYDMFANFQERGRVFREIVLAL